MTAVQESKVTLRIAGDDLDPSEITYLLGCQPDAARAKGDTIRAQTGVDRVAKFGMWRLGAAVCSPADLDRQITEILSKLTANPAVWSSIAQRYRVDLFCGIFMGGRNEGLVLRPEALAALGARHVELGLDIYAPDDDGLAGR